MYVEEAFLWATILGLGTFFTYEAFRPSSFEDDEALGVKSQHFFSLVFYPAMAAACWLIMAGFSNALNNCLSEFNACFTDPTLSATTVSIYPTFTDFNVLYVLFYGLFWLMIADLFLLILVIGLGVLQVGPGREKRDVTAPP